MAIDLKAMRAKLDAVKNKGGKIWKPKMDSVTKVRLLPMPGDGDPFVEKHFHYNLGNVSVLCPKRNFDEACPVCEFASALWNAGDDDSQAMAKKLFARQRFYSPLILREEKEPTVKVWGYSQTVYEKLLSKVLNPEFGDITDPETGTDFEITYEKSAGKLYPDTELEFSRSASTLKGSFTKTKVSEILDSIPDFDTLYDRKTTAEVQAILDSYLDNEESAPDSEGEGTSKFASTEETSVDGALDDLKSAKK